MTDNKKECLGIIKVETVYSLSNKPDHKEGQFIHRSLDVKNRFMEILRNVYREEKESIIDKREEIFLKSVKVLNKEQQINLLIAWKMPEINVEAKELVTYEEDDKEYAEELKKQADIVVKRRQESLEKLSEDEIKSTLIDEAKTQIAIAPALEAAYKYLIYETFRNPKDLKIRVFSSTNEVGETLKPQDFNHLIDLRADFENYSVGDIELKN